MEQQTPNLNQKQPVAQRIIVIALWVAILGAVVWLLGFKYPIFKWGAQKPPEPTAQPDEYSVSGRITEMSGLNLKIGVEKLTADGKFLNQETKTVRLTANTPITKTVEKDYQYTTVNLTFRDLAVGQDLAIYSAADPSAAAEIIPTRIEVVR